MPELPRTFRVGLVAAAAFAIFVAAGWAAWNYWSDRYPDGRLVVPEGRTATVGPATAPPEPEPALPSANGPRNSDETVPHIALPPVRAPAPSTPSSDVRVANTQGTDRPSNTDDRGTREVKYGNDELTGAPVPDDPMERHRVIKGIETATTRAVILYDLPDSMNAYEERRITIRLARGLKAGQVLAAPSLPIAPENVKLIRSADSVSIRLVGGRSFSIVGVQERGRRGVHVNDSSEWTYFVTAQEGGAKDLILEVTTGDDDNTMLAQLTKRINVTVPFTIQVWSVLDGWPKDFILPFAAGALSIIVAGWYERRTRKKSAPSDRGSVAAEAATGEG